VPIKREESYSEEINEGGEERNLDYLIALDLFRFTPQKGDVIWSDDRIFNSYTRRDTAQIIGVIDILYALRQRKAITEGEYYGKLYNLRAANLRYIPVRSEEILYHLKQARIIEGAVVETEQLATIRRYIASCLLDGDRLQKPPMPDGSPNPDGEMAFVTNTVRAVQEAILSGWTDESITDEVAVARADWLFGNLYTGRFGVRHLQNEANPESDRIDLIGLDLATGFSDGIVLPGDLENENKTRSAPRERYFQWLARHLTERRFSLDPLSTEVCARNLTRVLVGAVGIRYGDRDTNKLFKIRLNEFYNEEFTLTLVATDDPGHIILDISDHTKTKKLQLNDPGLGMLIEDQGEREKVLRSSRSSLDCSDSDFKILVDEISATDDPLVRLNRVHNWLKESAAVYYKTLEQKLIEVEEFNFDELIPPSGAGLLRHFRIELNVEADGTLATELNGASRLVCEAEGLEEALTRYACLPINLPDALKRAFKNLPLEEKRSLLDKFTRLWGSPISKLHILDLATHRKEKGNLLAALNN